MRPSGTITDSSPTGSAKLCVAMRAPVRATKRLPMPVLALGASDGVGDTLRATVATLGDRVKGGSIGQGCGHFLPSECPDDLVAAILAFWGETR